MDMTQFCDNLFCICTCFIHNKWDRTFNRQIFLLSWDLRSLHEYRKWVEYFNAYIIITLSFYQYFTKLTKNSKSNIIPFLVKLNCITGPHSYILDLIREKIGGHMKESESKWVKSNQKHSNVHEWQIHNRTT